MSLINDALKRTAQKTPPPPSPEELGAGLRPAEYQRRPSWLLLFTPTLVITGLLAGGWFLYRGWQLSHHSDAPLGPVPVAARSFPSVPEAASAQPAIPAPLLSATSAPVPVSAPAPSNEATAASVTSPTSTVSAETPAGKPAFPLLKLQGIYYRPANPSAVINGKTLFRGEKIERAKVVAIESDNVTIEWEGQTKVLTLQ